MKEKLGIAIVPKPFQCKQTFDTRKAVGFGATSTTLGRSFELRLLFECGLCAFWGWRKCGFYSSTASSQVWLLYMTLRYVDRWQALVHENKLLQTREHSDLQSRIPKLVHVALGHSTDHSVGCCYCSFMQKAIVRLTDKEYMTTSTCSFTVSSSLACSLPSRPGPRMVLSEETYYPILNRNIS